MTATSEARARHRPKGGFVYNVLPAVVYAVLIFVAGTLPTPMPPAIGKLPMDKLVHTVAFAVMQCLAFRALRFEAPAWSTRGQIVWAAICAAGIGGFLELYQAALPHRSAEFLDFVADTLGATLASLVLLYGGRWRSGSLGR